MPTNFSRRQPMIPGTMYLPALCGHRSPCDSDEENEDRKLCWAGILLNKKWAQFIVGC